MSLELDLRDAAERVTVGVATGTRRTLRTTDPDRVAETIAGLRTHPLVAAVRLDGVDLTGASAPRRARQGLQTALGTTAALPLTVVELLTLSAHRVERRLNWRRRTSRAEISGAEARARSAAAQCGLGSWLDAPLATLPADVEVLADAVRAVLGLPRALIYRVPVALSSASREHVAHVVSFAQHRHGFALLEIAAEVTER